MIGILRPTVKKLRTFWPRPPYILRADSNHSEPEVLVWLERKGLCYVISWSLPHIDQHPLLHHTPALLAQRPLVST